MAVIECQSLDEVRTEIDRIDRQIVSLMAERQELVSQAGHFKPTAAAVFDEARYEAIIAKVRDLARQLGASPDVVEQTYRAMVMGFTRLEEDEVRARG